jgi:hypothetical protein
MSHAYLHIQLDPLDIHVRHKTWHDIAYEDYVLYLLGLGYIPDCLDLMIRTFIYQMIQHVIITTTTVNKQHAYVFVTFSIQQADK